MLIYTMVFDRRWYCVVYLSVSTEWRRFTAEPDADGTRAACEHLYLSKREELSDSDSIAICLRLLCHEQLLVPQRAHSLQYAEHLSGQLPQQLSGRKK